MTAETMNVGSGSSPMNDGATEMNEVSKEFNRSLSIPDHAVLIVDAENLHVNAKDVPPAGKLDGAPSPEDSDKSKGTGNKAGKEFIAPKDFELLKVIGMGAFGKVLQVRNRHSSKIFAMKVISKRLIKRKLSYVENILAERNILSKIANHPFIVTMHASFQTREKLFIIMDFCAGGELFLKLGREGHFREKTAAFYLAEITLALEHLHSINVLHRDLKPENILLGSDGHCCLTDFGLAKDFTGSGDNEDERARTLCGTMEYMAPEMVARKWYGKGADYWSLGCIAYEMLSGLPPFSSKKGSKELFKKIMNERIRMPDGASAAACKLLKGLLNRDAGKRLGAARGTMFEVGGVGALKQQPFFSGLDWGKLELKEIDPPEDFSVDNDEDLRHFHDEFINMNLPRSVREMSKLDFLPRHCESENFRGFSFIGDSFPLPERSASEAEHYWNNVDDDGQSLSECASSVFDDDLGELPAPEPVPEKKKRPPRKKKKKKQQAVPPLETTKEGNEGNAGPPAGTDKASNGKQEGDGKIADDKKNGQSSGGGESATATKKPLSQPEDAKRTEDGIQQKTPDATPAAKDTALESTTKKLNPNAKAWGTVPPPKPLPQASTLKPTPTSQTKPAQPKPVATPAYKPKPGSWASLAVGNASTNNSVQRPAAQPTPSVPLATPSNNWSTVGRGKSNNNQRASAQSASANAVSSRASANNWSIESPKPPPKSPIKVSTPSSDWRNHVVSPRRKGLSPMTMKNLIPPPPVAQPGEGAWPSLGDFPPPPGAKAKEPKKQTAVVGAWGKK